MYSNTKFGHAQILRGENGFPGLIRNCFGIGSIDEVRTSTPRILYAQLRRNVADHRLYCIDMASEHGATFKRKVKS